MPCQRPHVDASLLCWQRAVALLPRSCQCFSNLVVVWCQSNSFLVFQALSLYHWWDWPLTWLTNHRSSVLWHFWLGHLTRKIVSEMTYNVSSWMLNPTIPYHSLSLSHRFLLWLQPWSLSTTMLLWHSFLIIITRGQSNLTKSASRGAHTPVRGHPRGSKVVPLNSWGRVSY